MKQAQGNTEIGQSTYGAARSGLFPQLTLQTQIQKSEGLSGPSSASEGYSAVLSGQQLILDFGKTPSKISSGRRLWEATSADSQTIMQAIIVYTSSAFYGLLKAQAVMAVAQEGLLQAEAHLTQAKILFDAGRGVRFQVVKAEVDVANARLALIESRNAVTAGRLQLENVLGKAISSTDSVLEKDTLVSAEIPADSAEIIARLNRPEIKAARLRLLAAQANRAAASRSRWPTVSGIGTYGVRSSKIDATAFNAWSVGINASMPLFLGGALGSQVLLTERNSKIAEAHCFSAEQQVAMEVEQ